LVILIFASYAPLFSAEIDGERELEAILRSVGRPVPQFPNNQTIYIENTDPLEFKWSLSTETLVALSYIELYIFKGERLTPENLVFSERLEPGVYSMKIDPALFDDNKIYTWGIRQFFLRGERSNEAFTSFKVRKSK
jgi:hypothetical protein